MSFHKYIFFSSIRWTLPAQCHVISLSTNISFFLTFFLNSLVAGTQWLHLAPVASLIHHWNEYFCKHQDDVKVVATLYGSISLIHHCNEFFWPHPHQQTTRWCISCPPIVQKYKCKKWSIPSVLVNHLWWTEFIRLAMPQIRSKGKICFN